MDILGNNQINIVLTAPLLYIENFIIIMPKKKMLLFIVCELLQKSNYQCAF